ncbi:hypothetical protein D920_00160 [Enterococcus faecalis 13-SD-W-01]|nr:hypothetical protein D920_00160 [Enterococcus faecalis 13-SD-W-01]
MIKKILASASQDSGHKLALHEAPINKEPLADFSKELILKAYAIYEWLLVTLGSELIQEYRAAFLLHIFLMVHRIIFDQQYLAEDSQIDQIILNREVLVGKIEAIFAENNLGINKSEISALFSCIQECINIKN